MMLQSLFLSSALLGLGAYSLPASQSSSSSSSVEQACSEIQSSLPASRVPGALSLAFTSEMQDYWSVALRSLKPTCMILPQDASEIATVVQILNKYPDVPFAVKSGGHSPNPGHATAKDGVLISTAEMKGAQYDAATGLAHVKPGGQWNDVIGDLQKQGVTMLGGRLGVVGVGGLLLQGGLSFLSAQHGMAADNIVEWEVVTANGTVRRVKASEEPDLAVAMRGSGSQFGIVTEYVVRAYERPPVWGGSRVFSSKQKIEQVLAAVYDFTIENKDDTKAAIIPATQHFAPGGELGAEILVLFIFYDGTAPPTDGPLAKVLAITPDVADTCKTQSYAALLQANGAVIAIDQSRQQFRTATLPHLPNVPDMLVQIKGKLSSLLAPVLVNPLRATGRCGVGFQPLPAVITSETQARGGNAMGLDDDLDRIVLELVCSGWQIPDDDEVFASVTRDLVSWIDDKLENDWTVNGKSEYYLPLFMNDGAWDQDVTKSYRDYEKFKALQEQIDPEGFFSKRCGGFKY